MMTDDQAALLDRMEQTMAVAGSNGGVSPLDEIMGLLAKIRHHDIRVKVPAHVRIEAGGDPAFVRMMVRDSGPKIAEDIEALVRAESSANDDGTLDVRITHYSLSPEVVAAILDWAQRMQARKVQSDAMQADLDRQLESANAAREAFARHFGHDPSSH
ncbi:MAG: hypothetical protein R3E87_15065 [Burkholderiaceae bacterium]